ncbi:MAG: hypothetical protein ABEK17_03565, partial [Candidatus Aenigmatarchaeota archaeon]
MKWNYSICEEGGISYCKGCDFKKEVEDNQGKEVKCSLDYEKQLVEGMNQEESEAFGEMKNDLLENGRGVLPVELAAEQCFRNKGKIVPFGGGNIEPLRIKEGEERDYNIRTSWMNRNCAIEILSYDEVDKSKEIGNLMSSWETPDKVKKLMLQGTLAHKLMFDDPDFEEYLDWHILNDTKREEYCETSVNFDLDIEENTIRCEGTPDAVLGIDGNDEKRIFTMDGKYSLSPPTSAHKRYQRQVGLYAMGLEKLLTMKEEHGAITYLKKLGRGPALKVFEIDEDLRNEIKDFALEID